MFAARIDRVLGFEHGLPPAYGLVIAVIGLVFLLFGWRLHRFTVIATGFLLGAFIGGLVARWIRVEKAWGIFIGGSALALLADPLSRLMIFLLAGLTLGIGLGEGVRLLIWSKGFLWGFFPGFVAGGFLSLWQMRFFVIVSTAFLGALALSWGGLVALGAWVSKSLITFHIRHPIYSLIILGLVFVVGLVVQIRLSPRHVQKEV